MHIPRVMVWIVLYFDMYVPKFRTEECYESAPRI